MSRVIVAGSINMDVVAEASKHPKVGETVLGEDIQFIPGGKGSNTAIASSKQEVETLLIGKIGRDDFGTTLENFLKSQGINLKYLLKTDQVKTGTAVVTLAQKDNTIVIIPGANFELKIKDLQSVAIKAGDILVSQFEIPTNIVEAFFKKGKKSQAMTILNPSPAKKVSKTLLKLSDILVINEVELAFYSGRGEIKDLSFKNIASLASKLKSFDAQVIVVTLGKLGVVVVEKNRMYQIPSKKVKVVDTTGAGDCFLGALAAKLAEGAELKNALSYANMAASLKVQRLGASSMPTKREVEKVLNH